MIVLSVIWSKVHSEFVRMRKREVPIRASSRFTLSALPTEITLSFSIPKCEATLKKSPFNLIEMPPPAVLDLVKDSKTI